MHLYKPRCDHGRKDGIAGDMSIRKLSHNFCLQLVFTFESGDIGGSQVLQ